MTKSPTRRYYTPYEVAKHNTPHDCWVSFLGGVYDLTSIIQAGYMQSMVAAGWLPLGESWL